GTEHRMASFLVLLVGSQTGMSNMTLGPIPSILTQIGMGTPTPSILILSVETRMATEYSITLNY
ncbi:MAG: hypothetical protein ACYTE5_04845, partial [Planctomycetota bacterium]